MTVSWLDHFRTPEYRTFRATVFVGLGLSGIVPFIHGLLIYGYTELNQKMSLNLVLLQGFLYVTGAAIYATRWPEMMLPGRFDIWGSSHQIFHLIVVMAAGVHLVGMGNAFWYRHGVEGR